jgi:hypothetical protein
MLDGEGSGRSEGREKGEESKMREREEEGAWHLRAFS